MTRAFNGMFSEEAMIALDAGRAFDGGKPPAELHFRDVRIPNPRKETPPRTILGVEQKAWFKDQLRKSTATWKIWGNSLGALDWRVGPAKPPAGMVEKPWPADTYAQFGSNDYGIGLRRAQGNLRPRARSEDHRLRDRFGGPAQLLGWICRSRSSAAEIRARGIELRRRVAGKPGHDGSL